MVLLFTKQLPYQIHEQTNKPIYMVNSQLKATILM